MKVETVTPGDYLGDVHRRHQSFGAASVQEPVWSAAPTSPWFAIVPLSEMFGLHRTVARHDRGRASYTMEFSHYTNRFLATSPTKSIAEVAKAKASLDGINVAE